MIPWRFPLHTSVSKTKAVFLTMTHGRVETPGEKGKRYSCGIVKLDLLISMFGHDTSESYESSVESVTARTGAWMDSFDSLLACTYGLFSHDIDSFVSYRPMSNNTGLEPLLV